MSIHLTSDNFQSEILNYTGLAIVDFWAPWCGPCRMVGPILDEISREYQGKIKVGKVNVDENMLLQAHYDIMSIPTMIIFKNGDIVDKVTGAVPKAVIVQKLEKWLI
ncbi:MAG: thioredoxin [Bacillota bacterium]